MREIAARMTTAWMNAVVRSKGLVPLVLGGAIVAGGVLATNADVQQAFSEATSLSVTSTAPVISAETGEPAVVLDDSAYINPASPKIQWFVRGSENYLWTRRWAGAWKWESIAGISARSAPAIATWGNVPYLFVQGPDNALWYSKKVGTAWGAWQSLGGNLSSGPAAISEWNRVFIRGTDNRYWWRALANRAADGTDNWSDWQAAPDGFFTSRPALAVLDGMGYVFGKGMDNALYYRRSSQYYWDSQNWQSLGGVLTSGFAAVSLSATSSAAGVVFWSTDLIVAGRGNDNAMWYRRLHQSGSSVTTGAPAATPVWSDWTSTGGSFTSGPSARSATAATPNTGYFYGRGSDGRMYRSIITMGGSPFSTWDPLD